MRKQLCLTEYFLLTVVDPPLSPPPLSTPAGAERGANSRIWARFLTVDVQGLRQRRTAIKRGCCISGNDDCTHRFDDSYPAVRLGMKQRSPSSSPPHPSHTHIAHKPPRRVRLPSIHKAKYGCWPLFPPRRGGSEAGEIGGGKANKKTFLHPTEALSSKTPITAAGAAQCQ